MQIFGERVVVVAGGRLAGLAEPSAVIGDDAVACAQKDWRLFLPGGAAQRISMNKDNRCYPTSRHPTGIERGQVA
jgi:hypothetical protein